MHAMCKQYSLLACHQIAAYHYQEKFHFYLHAKYSKQIKWQRASDQFLLPIYFAGAMCYR
jgi:hypothetical protein